MKINPFSDVEIKVERDNDTPLSQDILNSKPCDNNEHFSEQTDKPFEVVPITEEQDIVDISDDNADRMEGPEDEEVVENTDIGDGNEAHGREEEVFDPWDANGKRKCNIYCPVTICKEDILEKGPHICPICPTILLPCEHLLKDHMRLVHGWFKAKRNFLNNS